MEMTGSAVAITVGIDGRGAAGGLGDVDQGVGSHCGDAAPFADDLQLSWPAANASVMVGNSARA